MKKNRDSPGFTLIEILVSVGIISSVFVSLITLQLQSLRVLEKIKNTTIGLMIVTNTDDISKIKTKYTIEINPYLEEKYLNFKVERDVIEADEILPFIPFISDVPNIPLTRITLPDDTVFEFVGGE